MKDLLYSILTLSILPILFISCSGSNESETKIKRAESLIDNNPDSALAAFDSIDPSGLSRRQRMRYHLQRTLAQNRAYVPFTTDSVMREVVEYYDSHGIPNEQLLANYLMGRVYSDMDNPMVALEFFHKAVEKADTASADCDFMTLSRVHGQMASLFGHQLLPEYELKEEQLAIDYAWKAKDTLAALIFYEHLVGPYSIMGLKDSVISISNNVSAMYRKYGYKQHASACWPSAIFTFLRKGKYKEAKILIDDLMQNSGWTDEKGNFKKGHEGCYDFIGMYYEGINKLDSAEYIYRKVLSNPIKMPNHEIAIKGLMSVYQKRSIPDSVSKYARMYCEYNDSSYRILLSEKVNRMQAIYDYSHNQQLLDRKTIETERYKMFIGLFIFVTSIISYIIYKVYKKRKRIKDDILKKSQEEYAKKLLQYSKAKKEYMQLQHNYDEYKEIKRNEIKQLQEMLSMMNGSDTRPDDIKTEESLSETDIIKKLRLYSAKGKQPSNNDWKEFEETVNTFIPEFITDISKENYGLTSREIQICILIRLQFQTSEIRNLLDISSQYITNIRGIINKKLFNAKGAKDLDKNIRMM